jgi:hypothetical protein
MEKTTIMPDSGELPFNNTVYLCGDKEKKGCGLSGKLVAFDCCGSCQHSSGQIGKNCIKAGAKIHHGE